MTQCAEEYRSFFDSLRLELQHSKAAREGWIGFLYHVTDIQNVVDILRGGHLLSRREAIAQGRMKHDNADPGVISFTDSDVSKYVRLYFRPQTPTFYRNEGFRSKSLREKTGFDAHCPVPVALVFDAPAVLSLPGTRFSSGNLAAWSGHSLGERTLQGLNSLRSLPFEGIYHSEPIYPDNPNKKEIVRQRNAEVIVPRALFLDRNLLAVRCRSDAELATLRTLLGIRTWRRYRSQSGINTDASLFVARWLFLERVRTLNRALILHIHQPIDSDERKQVFEVTITVEYDMGNRSPLVAEFELKADRGPILRTPPGFLATDEPGAVISIQLDGQLAYKGVHWFDDEPMLFPPSEYGQA